MKGRILYSEANKAIDIFNQTAIEKYKIVRMTKGLTDYHRNKKAEFKEQDGKDTESECSTSLLYNSWNFSIYTPNEVATPNDSTQGIVYLNRNRNFCKGI